MVTVDVNTFDPSWEILNEDMKSKILINEDNKILKSVSLYITQAKTSFKFTTYSGSLITPDSLKNPSNNLKVKIVVNGVSSDTQTINNVTNMEHTAAAGATEPYNCQQVWANSNKIYTFTFSNGVKIGKSQEITVKVVSGFTNRKNLLSVRKGRGLPAGYAVVEDEITGPTSISFSPTNVWITDLNGASTNANVFNTSSKILSLTQEPSNAVITTATFSGDANTTNSYNNKQITTKAKNLNTNYPTKDIVTLTVNGGASASFTVNFYEKVNPTLESSSSELDLNIRTVASQGFTISNYNPETNDAKSKRLFFDNNKVLDFSLEQFNNLSRYINIDNRNENFNESNENIWHEFKWRFYNSAVQNEYANENEGSYKKDIITKVRWSITPTIQSQFSYKWFDSAGNELSETDIPKIIMSKKESKFPTIGYLTYTNENISGGYCRGFRIEYINSNNITSKAEYFDVDVDSSGQTVYKNKNVINSFDLATGFYTIKITCYFHYGNNSENDSNRYYGVSKTLTQKLLVINDKELLPSLYFPTLAQNLPYTPMMLEDIERFGYDFTTDGNSILVNSQIELNADFGLKISCNSSTIYCSIKNNNKYFSSNKITEHLVFNIGAFVRDNQLYSNDNKGCIIKPYVDLYYGTIFEERISVDTNYNDKIINAILNTSENTFWNRPEISKGNLIEYFDYNRFMKFINKYKNLFNGQELEVPLDKKGEIIKTDFWEDVADTLDIYAVNMQNWATNIINILNLWALPRFLHKKGEIITNNNLYQNYWDLLHQHSGADGAFATHDFLNENNFTHNYLNDFTYNEITNKEGL